MFKNEQRSKPQNVQALIRKTVQTFIRFINNIIYPPICAICFKQRDRIGRDRIDRDRIGKDRIDKNRINQNNIDIDLCAFCKVMLPWVEDRCYRCGLSLYKTNEAMICENCTLRPPYFDRVCALFSYVPPVKNLIYDFKFNGRLGFGRLFGQLLLQSMLSEWYRNVPLPQGIIPVPLHDNRLRTRGFNQAQELALSIHHTLRIPLLLDVCYRPRFTKPQARLNAEKRSKNIRNAFKVIKPIPYSHVAVIDDVVTTAKTMNEVCKVLKRAGVEWIDVICVCRA